MSDTGYVMFGVPVNIHEERPDVRMPDGRLWEPGEGYEQRRCQHCEVGVWLGPRQLIALDLAQPGHYALLCLYCVELLNELRQALGVGPQEVRELGGR